jgi:predicted transcriptional regulator
MPLFMPKNRSRSEIMYDILPSIVAGSLIVVVCDLVTVAFI